MATIGGRTRAKARTKAEIRAWGKQGRRPTSLRGKALARLKTLLGQGKSQAECAKLLGVSVSTIGRIVTRIKPSDNHF